MIANKKSIFKYICILKYHEKSGLNTFDQLDLRTFKGTCFCDTVVMLRSTDVTSCRVATGVAQVLKSTSAARASKENLAGYICTS